MTLMTTTPTLALWCPHPSWLGYGIVLNGTEFVYYVHCARCGEPREIKVEVA